MSQWRGRRGEKGCARKIGSDGNHQQRTGGFFAGLPSIRNVTFNGDGREQENGENRAADHPAHRDPGEGGRSGLEYIVQTKIADRFDDSGKDETKCQDERGAVVCAAEAHQGISRVAKA